mmetsp:Transcript_1747/g.2737  ORF Transcript_1747/g.2737 Transcript_1747/m.2737 type:complete len:176 (-) Transcript_1747:262-789(-)
MMGNTPLFSDTNDREYKTGRRLFVGISTNSREATEMAIEYARKECVKPHGPHASVMEYTDMIHTMIEYLTRVYPEYHMTPLQYASSKDSQIAATVISDTIKSLQTASRNIKEQPSQDMVKSLRKRQMLYDFEKRGLEPPPERTTEREKIAPTVTKDRAIEAKARLIAFRAQKDQS